MSIPTTNLGKTGLTVSRLGLGTAEIGFAYGLGPTSLPPEDDALALLNRAYDVGVTFFDTANYYGAAEERLGKSGLLTHPDVVVCTKCAQFLEKGEYFEKEELEKKIREQVEGSLDNLGIEALPLLLLHGPSAKQLEEGVLVEIIEALKKEGKIRFWGASTRGEESPLAVIAAEADVIQVAFNIADRRMAERVFESAWDHNVGVVNRSIYLKGVFAGKDAYLPDNLSPLKAVAAEAQHIADGLGITRPELSLRYALSEPVISSTLIGTGKIKNLEAAVNAIEKGPLPDDVVLKLRALALTEADQVDPARWGV